MTGPLLPAAARGDHERLRELTFESKAHRGYDPAPWVGLEL